MILLRRDGIEDGGNDGIL